MCAASPVGTVGPPPNWGFGKGFGSPTGGANGALECNPQTVSGPRGHYIRCMLLTLVTALVLHLKDVTYAHCGNDNITNDAITPSILRHSNESVYYIGAADNS